jgi:hypothetical protein
MRKRWEIGLHTARLGLLALLLLLAACSSAPNGTNGTPTPNAAAGQVVIQLFPALGFIAPQFNGVPRWTLYADGTLLFQSSGAANTLLQAHLSASEMQHIVDTVVNQYHFFDSSQPAYGVQTPDVGSTLLIVHANGQRGEVDLGQSAGDQPDQQTKNVFAIQAFLLQQEPTSATPYDPPGIALLVLPSGEASTVNWPFDDISLGDIAVEECPLLLPPDQCTTTGQNGAIKMLTGSRAKAILGSSGFANIMMQQGKSYRILPWPLLPDALHPAPGSAALLTVTRGATLLQWPLK